MPPLKLTVKSLKCTVVLTPDQIAGFDVPNGSGPVPFMIAIGGRRIAGTFNTRSLRRAVAAVATTPGIANIIIQGTLTDTNTLEGAGISAPPPKAVQAVQAEAA